ncbi:hypothetical protein [Aestuariibius sp. HNIBRBA575]|uniref:hypothetical protein n=1 Tax=Aestuariibius sp. HNIBRBA575 TaxID=3233343 RepID=UPI0034A47967
MLEDMGKRPRSNPVAAFSMALILWRTINTGKPSMNDTNRVVLAQVTDLREEISESLILLSSVRRTLLDLLTRVSEGEADALKGLSKKHSELESAVKAAKDTERRFNEWECKFNGKAREGEIDFDAIREDIGRRIARLID